MIHCWDWWNGSSGQSTYCTTLWPEITPWNPCKGGQRDVIVVWSGMWVYVCTNNNDIFKKTGFIILFQAWVIGQLLHQKAAYIARSAEIRYQSDLQNHQCVGDVYAQQRLRSNRQRETEFSFINFKSHVFLLLSWKVNLPQREARESLGMFFTWAFKHHFHTTVGVSGHVPLETQYLRAIMWSHKLFLVFLDRPNFHCPNDLKECVFDASQIFSWLLLSWKVCEVSTVELTCARTNWWKPCISSLPSCSRLRSSLLICKDTPRWSILLYQRNRLWNRFNKLKIRSSPSPACLEVLS